MGPAVFVGLVLCAVIIIGFMTYGVFLGLAALATHISRLWNLVLAFNGGSATVTVDERSPNRKHRSNRLDKSCWEINCCPESARASCPACRRPDLPCWLANMQASEELRLKPDCLTCKLFNIPALMTGA